MTLMQRLRGMLPTDQTITAADPHVEALRASGVVFQSTTADHLRAEWDGATVRDPVLRDAMTRIAVRADQAAVSWVWRFQDGSGVVANDEGVFVL